MNKTLYLFFILLSFCTVFAQNTTELSKFSREELDVKIQEYKLLAHSNPSEGIKKLLEAKNQCVRINHKDGAMKSSMGLVLIYYNDGDYKKSLEETKFAEKYAKELQYTEYLSDIHRMRSNVYGEMGLLKESLEELGKTFLYTDKIKKADIRFYKKALIYESYAGIYDKKGDTNKQLYYRRKSITESNKMLGDRPTMFNAKFQNLAYQYASMGYVYSQLKAKDSADYYFGKALDITEDKKYEVYINVRATLYSDIAKFYNENGNSKKAILFARRAEILERQATMPYIRKDIYHTLFNSYMETDKKDSSKHYLDQYSSLSDSLLKSEKKNMLAPVNQVILDKENESKDTVRNVLITSSTTFIFLILGGWFYWKRKSRTVHQKYDVLIAKIKEEKVQQNNIIIPQENDKLNKQETFATITEETTKALLRKLEKFEVSDKYLKKDISLPWLATSLNTNTKYLSEIIKIYRDKNFNDYINGLRINYILHKLVEQPHYREYKITYIAKECGFASSQVFVIHFKKVTGFTPSYFIENLKKEKLL